MVTKIIFLQDFFGFLKNGQKKCPKLKIPKYFWEKKSLKYNKFSKQLKEKGRNFLAISICKKSFHFLLL
jgi:hypothetical protein